MRLMVIILAFSLFFSSVSAQESKRWTLDDCVKYAQEHNTDIKLAELNAETRQVALSNAKWAYSPEISVSNSYTFSAGRVLDPTTYQFVENQYVSGNNTSVGASIGIFNGMRNMHTLKRSQLDLKSALLGIEKARNDIRLNVTAYYLEILCGEENIRNAEQVVQTLRIQEDKTAKLVEAKKVTTADLLQIRSELAKAENNLLSARNSYDIARLNICQLLEIDDYTAFNTVAPTESLMPDAATGFESNAVVEAAQSLPELEAARLGIKIADRDLSIARAAYYPSLSLSAGYGTSYSDARLKAFQNPDGTYRYEAYSFASQYKDNTSGFISLGLNIPIFGRIGKHGENDPVWTD